MNLFNIPVGQPFFATFVKALLAGEIIGAIGPKTDPLALFDLTVFVPTRRAARALAQELAKQFLPVPVILPKIIPLGDPADLDERSILDEDLSFEDPTLWPAIAPLTRQLHLMQLIERWRVEIRQSLIEQTENRGPLLMPGDLFQVAASPADAFALAGDLAALMDEMSIEKIDWGRLKGLAPDHDDYWSITLRFLEIASVFWPEHLEEQKLMDGAARRHALLSAECQRLRLERPVRPMIVAGSTGSQPATADLMAAIAALPNGAVVLPGLDRHLSDLDWGKISVNGPDMALGLTSPQAALKRLLEQRIKAGREDVRDIVSDHEAWRDARYQLVSEVLRPADTTDKWVLTGDTDGFRAAASDGITLIEAADEREEALAIALVLRKVLATNHKQAAFVTPDRALAARVSAELARFDVSVDDSAGNPLASELRGTLGRLALAAAVSDFAPADVLALLYHPLVTLGKVRQNIETVVAALDICVLRRAYTGVSVSGLSQAVEQALGQPITSQMPAAQRRMMAVLRKYGGELQQKLEAALLPLAKALSMGAASLSALANLHVAALAALTSDEEGLEHHFEGADGVVLERLFEALAMSPPDAPGFAVERDREGNEGAIYPALFEALTRAEPVRRSQVSHPRLQILGPLEARLLDVDLVVMGGLNEGSWPPTVSTDAFLNRPMRAAIGLSPPERRIGQSAHDFSMLMGMKEVVLTRAGRQQDQPTIASRFLRRMKAFLGKNKYDALRQKGDEFVHIARHIDDLPAEKAAQPIQRPEPKPPVGLRPTRLSITEIETLYRDPYALFARHVLQLDPLKPRFPVPGAAERGSLVHEAIATFISRYPAELPANALETLLQIGRATFDPMMHHLDVETYWWPRFELTAAWFMDWESDRRSRGIKPLAELPGALEFDLADGSSFTLRGRSDRIDLLSDGSFAIIDYKTGTPPSVKQVLAGFNPQLTLTAAMVQHGAFKGVAPERSVSEMLYIKLMGKAGEEGKITAIKDKDQTLDELADEHLESLKLHLLRYQTLDKGYISRRAPNKLNYISDYDHLARVKEWADVEDMEDEA